MSHIILLLVLGYVLSLCLIPVVLLLKKQPVATVAWLLTIVMLPYLGALLFVVFGINRVQRRIQRRQATIRALAPQLEDLSRLVETPGGPLSPLQDELMRVCQRLADTECTIGNDIKLLTDTHETLRLIEQSILSARHSLHLEYYIWRPDRTGTRLRDLLIRKARDGVQVRLLYDGIGSHYLGRRFLRPMRDAGIQVAVFSPGESFRERLSVNLRNHRKIVVVDGKLGFTGGMNVGDEYLGRNPNYGFWRDTHLRVRGPCVLQLQRIFAEDWYYATGEDLTGDSMHEYFPEPESDGDVCAQVVPGAPYGDLRVLESLMFVAINQAHHQVNLATSYFVPPESLLIALATAACRGVRVRVIVGGPHTRFWTLLAARSYYDILLQAGVEIYEYRKGVLHSKTLSVDGQWCLVGSPNFDFRSLILNFEAAVAIYDSKLTQQLDAAFEKDVRDATRVDAEAWNRRPRSHVLGENFFRLFAPLL